jgi:hypothetical protein
MNRFERFFRLPVLLLISFFMFAGISPLSSASLPDVYGVHGMDAFRLSGDKDWNWTAPGNLPDVEAEPDGSVLFAGGGGGAFLLKQTQGAWREVWNWESLGFKPGELVSVAAAQRDPYGRAELILAAEPAKSRIFLAEARSHQVKIRWEYRTALPPRHVEVCMDNGHFLVLSGDGDHGGAWKLEEVDFRQDKPVWILNPPASLTRPSAAVRTPSGWTVVSDIGTGRVTAFNRSSAVVWERALGEGALSDCPLAIEKGKGRSCVLAAAVGMDGKTVLYRLDAAKGTVLGRWDSHLKNGVPSPLPVLDALSPLPSTRARRRP